LGLLARMDFMLELLTLEEVQQLLRFSKTKVYQECRAGRLRVHRFGRLVRVNRKDLDEYVENASAQKTSDRPEAG